MSITSSIVSIPCPSCGLDSLESIVMSVVVEEGGSGLRSPVFKTKYHVRKIYCNCPYPIYEAAWSHTLDRVMDDWEYTYTTTTIVNPVL